MSSGIRWTVCDRYGNDVYLTQERWQHIVEPFYHPEMSGFERQLKETARSGMRKQDSLNPQKYRYIKPFFLFRPYRNRHAGFSNAFASDEKTNGAFSQASNKQQGRGPARVRVIFEGNE